LIQRGPHANGLACKLMRLQPEWCCPLWGENQLDVRPSRANCSNHSAGGSRKAATPMPRGSRPSMAALTRPGAMNASEIVMLTWRTLSFLASGDILDCCAVEDDLIEPRAPARDRFEERHATLEFYRPHAMPFDSCRHQDLLEPLWRRFGP
jgi:hypothetical protein